MYRILVYPVIVAVAAAGFATGRWLELSGVLHGLLESGGTAVGVPERVFREPPGRPPPEAEQAPAAPTGDGAGGSPTAPATAPTGEGSPTSTLSPGEISPPPPIETATPTPTETPTGTTTESPSPTATPTDTATASTNETASPTAAETATPSTAESPSTVAAGSRP